MQPAPAAAAALPCGMRAGWASVGAVAGWRWEFQDVYLDFDREDLVVHRDGRELLRIDRRRLVYWHADPRPRGRRRPVIG